MKIQAKIPPALAAIHNLIMNNDPTDIDHYLMGNSDNDLDPNPGVVADNDFGSLSQGAVTAGEKLQASQKRDQIAEAMWNSYVQAWNQEGENAE